MFDFVMAGLNPAISIRGRNASEIEIAGTRPATTMKEHHAR
jgi:hypothetical protein